MVKKQAVKKAARRHSHDQRIEMDINIYHHYPEGKDAHLTTLKALARIEALIKALGTDPKKLAEISAQLDANTAALEKGVADNTP